MGALQPLEERLEELGGSEFLEVIMMMHMMITMVIMIILRRDWRSLVAESSWRSLMMNVVMDMMMNMIMNMMITMVIMMMNVIMIIMRTEDGGAWRRRVS